MAGDNRAIAGSMVRRVRPATWIAWGLAVPWLLWALARAFGLEAGSIGVALIAFTPYIAFSAVIPVVVAAALRAWAAAAVALIAAVALLIAVLPRAVGGPTEPAGSAGPTLRVLAANMRLGKGAAGPLFELARELDADVLSVEELTPRLARRLSRLGIGDAFRHRLLATEDGARGSGLYSRPPIDSGSVTRLPGGFPLISAPLRLAGAPAVDVVSVHTSPPTEGSWDADLAALPAAAPTPLRVLIGDFNATLDHAAFRDLLDSGYDDAAETLGDGLGATWPVGRRIVPPLFAIDHVLVDPRIGVRDYSVHDIPHSDHRAVFAELELPAGYDPPHGR
jgi:endonuclease/exonuclease/phosphatase family metal-dependent hydrolase